MGSLRTWGGRVVRKLRRLKRAVWPARAIPYLFDRSYYLERYPDLRRSEVEPFEHYLRFGAAEGRDPSPLFATAWYLKQNPDVRVSGLNPLVHYARYGAAEGRNPHPRFDAKAYVADNPKAVRSKLSPLAHFYRSTAARRGARAQATPRAEGGMPDKGNVEGRATGARSPRRMLFIDGGYPTPDRDSGSIDVVNFIRMFQALGFEVHFIACSEFGDETADDIRRTAYEGVRRLGAKIIDHRLAPSVARFLESHGSDFEVALLSRVSAGGQFYEQIRANAPDAAIIFSPVDLHYLRDRRDAMLRRDRAALRESQWTEGRERRLVRGADATIVVSEAEAGILARQEPGSRVITLPLLREVPGARNGFATRRNIGFIGGFKHKPNVDAVAYFLDRIWPIVRAELPDAKFLVIGPDVPTEMTAFHRDGVEFLGHVPDLTPVLEELRLMIAPLRFGAGAKGKVVTSMSYGLPCVATPVAAEGMGLSEATGVVTAESPSEFAGAVADIYRDPLRWTRLSQAAVRHARERHSIDAGIAQLEALLAHITARA